MDADIGKKTFECSHGATKYGGFRSLIYNERLIDILRALQGPTVRYTQHSDLHAHRAGGHPVPGSTPGGWHCDSACRDFNGEPDWDETVDPYKVTRMAFYFQSYAESHSSLAVIPGSHRPEKRLCGIDHHLWRWIFTAEYYIKRLLRKTGLIGEPCFYNPCVLQRTPILSRPRGFMECLRSAHGQSSCSSNDGE